MKLDKLTPMQKHVTKENGTEPPYQNEYWDNTEEGIYVDIISGEPLFSSNDQYDAGCGWPSLTKPIKKNITKKNGTEPPYQNEYWDNIEEGIYFDIISGEPLFSSNDQYDAGCGWPSFTKTIKDEEVLEKEDNTLGMRRVEVRSKT